MGTVSCLEWEDVLKDLGQVPFPTPETLSSRVPPFVWNYVTRERLQRFFQSDESHVSEGLIALEFFAFHLPSTTPLESGWKLKLEIFPDRFLAFLPEPRRSGAVPHRCAAAMK